MSNRFRPAWLLVLAALSTSALAKAPETVNIGYQKANIFALLKYRGTLEKTGHCRTLGRIPRRAANAGGAERR